MFSWVSRHPERVHGEGWVTETKNKDTGKKMLNYIIIETNKGWCGVTQVPKILGWVEGGGYVYHCVIEIFVALFVLSLCPFGISAGVGAFVI